MTVSAIVVARGGKGPQSKPPILLSMAATAWPKLLALTALIAAWQAVYLAAWWPATSLPGPDAVLHRLANDLANPGFWDAVGITARRAVEGYGVALLSGAALGALVAGSGLLRRAIGPALLGLQSMPSITWFPFAIVLFQPSEPAILFVVVLGAAPTIAAGLLAGVEQVPPLLARVGHSMGARGFHLYRFVMFPAALPTFVIGMKQGWAFAWRGLMAGELLMAASHQPSLGISLDHARRGADSAQMVALMIVVFVFGATADGLFGLLTREIRARWG